MKDQLNREGQGKIGASGERRAASHQVYALIGRPHYELW